MTACSRDECRGALMRDAYGYDDLKCTLCGRGDVAARPPTAEELHALDRRLPTNETDYLAGLYSRDISEAQAKSKRVW